MLESKVKTFGRSGRWLVLVLLLLAGTWTNTSAAPTVNSDGSFVAYDISSSADIGVRIVPEISGITPYSYSQLADISTEFTKPVILLVDSQAQAPANVKSLPPIPAAFLMALIGFICISLVKDRRTWLAAVAGLLSLSQAGIDAVPELVRYIQKQQIKQLYSQMAIYMCGPENSLRLRCDVEGTRYIGLLHHLAGIPVACRNSTSTMEGRRITSSHIYKTSLNRFPVCAFSGLVALTSVIIQRLNNLTVPPNCLVSAVGQLIFNPEYLFVRVRLSRSESGFCVRNA